MWCCPASTVWWNLLCQFKSIKNKLDSLEISWNVFFRDERCLHLKVNNKQCSRLLLRTGFQALAKDQTLNMCCLCFFLKVTTVNAGGQTEQSGHPGSFQSKWTKHALKSISASLNLIPICKTVGQVSLRVKRVCVGAKRRGLTWYALLTFFGTSRQRCSPRSTDPLGLHSSTAGALLELDTKEWPPATQTHINIYRHIQTVHIWIITDPVHMSLFTGCLQLHTALLFLCPCVWVM